MTFLSASTSLNPSMHDVLRFGRAHQGEELIFVLKDGPRYQVSRYPYCLAESPYNGDKRNDARLAKCYDGNVDWLLCFEGKEIRASNERGGTLEWYLNSNRVVVLPWPSRGEARTVNSFAIQCVISNKDLEEKIFRTLSLPLDSIPTTLQRLVTSYVNPVDYVNEEIARLEEFQKFEDSVDYEIARLQEAHLAEKDRLAEEALSSHQTAMGCFPHLG